MSAITSKFRLFIGRKRIQADNVILEAKNHLIPNPMGSEFYQAWVPSKNQSFTVSVVTLAPISVGSLQGRKGLYEISFVYQGVRYRLRKAELIGTHRHAGSLGWTYTFQGLVPFRKGRPRYGTPRTNPWACYGVAP